jgi:hypothetical protein
VKEAYRIYKELIVYYGVKELLAFSGAHSFATFEDMMVALPSHPRRTPWVNVGGQLLPKTEIDALIENIKHGTIKNWNEVHQCYQHNGKIYPEQKLHHAFASLLELLTMEKTAFTPSVFATLLKEAVATKTWMMNNIFDSRSKDYQSAFRRMLYDNEQELENVIGKLDDNVFINQQRRELEQFKEQADTVCQQLGLLPVPA